MEEVWKTIPHEDAYEVSSCGRVRNKKTKHVKRLRFDRYGYLRVTLYPSGRTYTVHRLAMMTFLPGNEHLEVNHKNGDKADNNIKNLEWVTRSENAYHKSTVLSSKWKGSLNPSAKLTYAQAYYIKYTDHQGKTNKQIGEMFGVDDETVRNIRNGINWPHI